MTTIDPQAVVKNIMAAIAGGKTPTDLGFIVMATGGSGTAYVADTAAGAVWLTDADGESHEYGDEILVGVYPCPDRSEGSMFFADPRTGNVSDAFC